MKSVRLYSAVAAIVVVSIAHGKVCPLDNVDPFIGTGGNGHTTPAAAYPFGMVQPGPDTGHEGWERCSGYRYGDKAIQRFSQNHLSGTGCSEFGDLGFMPSADDPEEALGRDYKCGFEKKNERASPGYYAVTLDCGTKVEATCTKHVSLFRFTFPKGKQASLLFDPSWSFDKTKSVQVSPMKKRCVSGHVDREGWPGHEYWFAWEISAEPRSSRVVDNIKVEDGTSPKSVYRFDISKNNVVCLKVSLSRTSEKGARRNITKEIPGWDFDGVLAANRAAWRGILGRVNAKGEPHKIKNFYTAIYHLCFQPNLISDVGEDDLYSTFSCWDTFRAAGPLYTILTPEYVPAFINSMLWHFDKNGFLPVWTLWGGDNQCMNGVHSVPMIVDAYLKGFKGVDWNRAYEYVRVTLREDRGRCDAEYGMLDKYGYFPCDFMDEESVSRLLESCYDDACAARFAKALGGREADAKFFLDRSRAWTNCFDAATGFMRAKDSKGAWREPFDPYAIHGKGLHNYTEGNAFHWNWHVMQEPDLLIEMLGGKSAALKRLEGLFNDDPGRNEGALSDVTGLIGQYCQGNEPCHHDIYFFTLMGRRDLAAKYVREVMDTQYYPSPTGLCGNEDCGQMSAWYIFSAMGFYPFDPCGGEYVLGEPQLDEISIDVGSGKVFRIVGGGSWSSELELEKGTFTNSPHSNSELQLHTLTPTQFSSSNSILQLHTPTIHHADIMKGGTLAFVGGSAKYNYIVDTSAAPELDQWMRTKMLPAGRKWYPKLVEMFPSEGWEAPKTITLNFNAKDDSPPAYTCGDVVTFGRKWIKGNPEDVGCGIHEIFHVVQDDYPDEKTFWLQEGIADYVRWYLYEPESHGCDMDLSSDEVHYDGAYRVSANFLDFVERRYPGTVRELNALCRQGKYDEKTYWKKRTGKGVKELETEWKNQSKQPFRNYRFCVDRTKSPTDCMQLSEFELLDAEGKVIPAGKFELVYDGSGGDDNFGDGEKPECAVDGNLDTKWLDFRASHDSSAVRRSAVWIQFKFAEPTKISGYRWYTANDDEDRDPRDWRFLGSNDGVNWVVVDKVENFEATSDRKKLAFIAKSVQRIRFTCDNDVLTRAYEVAINDALRNVHMFQDGALTEPARCIMAGEVYDTPWTRDTAINVWNAFALLDREVSRNTLMSVAEKTDDDGYIITGQYWDAIIWAIGAYKYILVSGDQDFVKIAQSAIENSLAKYEREEFDEKDGLFRGPAVYGDGVAAYPDAYANTASSGIEDWASVPENRNRVAKKGVGIPMKALSTNCVYYKAYLILAKLNEKLGKDGSDALKKAEALKAAINKAFWNETKGTYDYLAGECDYQEALGISYALLFGIADERQAKLVLKNVKVTEQGIACVEPSFERYRKAGGFGRHSGVVWPHAQGFWARAAFEKGGREAFEAELHALAGKANRDGQFYEVYHPETGEAYGGLQEKLDGKKLVIGDWMSCPHQTWSATAYLSLIYYHVLGADIREGEVVFKPYLPEVVNEIAVKDFKVGETTFDIVVVRGGNGPKEATCKTTEKNRVKLFLSVAK